MTFIFEKAQFQTIQSTFKQYAAQASNSASDMLLYNIIRGKDPRRGFSPVTNTNKLANGTTPWMAHDTAKRDALWRAKKSKELFGIALTDEHRAALQAALEA